MRKMWGCLGEEGAKGMERGKRLVREKILIVTIFFWLDVYNNWCTISCVLTDSVYSVFFQSVSLSVSQ